MTTQRRTQILTHIEELKTALQRWTIQPMPLETARDIGSRAIREELTRISCELKLDDARRTEY